MPQIIGPCYTEYVKAYMKYLLLMTCAIFVELDFCEIWYDYIDRPTKNVSSCTCVIATSKTTN